MEGKEYRERAFSEQIGKEFAQNMGAISEIFSRSRVGHCGGKCKGYEEKLLSDLCSECLLAIEQESEAIFSVSPMLRLLADAMNTMNSRD